MEIRRYDDANDFYKRAERFLIEHEAEHNLLLGICAGVIAHPERQEHPPYLATIEAGGEIVAAAVMTPPRGPVLSRIDAPEALPLLVDDLRRDYPALPSVLGPAGVSGAFADLWRRATGRPHRKGVAERIYQLDAVTPVVGVPGALRRATEADRALAVAWAVAFQREALGDDDPRTAAHGRRAPWRRDGQRSLSVGRRPARLAGRLQRADTAWHSCRPRLHAARAARQRLRQRLRRGVEPTVA